MDTANREPSAPRVPLNEALPAFSPAIPRVFHHIWLGSDEVPEEIEGFRKTWRVHHPEWDLRLWRESELDWLRNQALFDRAGSYAQKADIARYEIIHRFGGVYLDADMESLRPIDTLLDGLDFFAAYESNGHVCNSIFGAAAGSPPLSEVIRQLPASCVLHRRGSIATQTGPGLLTRCLHGGGWEARGTRIRLFPPPFFYPYHWSEPWRRDDRFPTAYAVHHWSDSWKDQRGLSVSASDVLVRDGGHLPANGRALAAAARAKASGSMRRRVASPMRRRASRLLRRVSAHLNANAAPAFAVPWGEGQVLVSTPFHTRLLCPTEDLSLSPELALYGTYDPPFVRVLASELRAGMTFVDVGANVGLFTILAAARVGRGGRVFAYECNPELLSFLERNVEMNWFSDRVRVVPKAAHRDREPREFIAPRELKMLGSLTRHQAQAADTAHRQRLEVQCEPLDERLADVPFVDILKIDVEGGEADVLDGATALIETGRVGTISIEYRDDALREELRHEMESRLRILVERGARFEVPGDRRAIPLDEVLTAFDYSQLLIRLPNARI